ncbi:M24 family metallopeptidase [Pseudomonas sp. CAN2814]|jgi:Xaa-Pro aminopeptidase|uniref:M24 family metallopeptidase n=1 Tax=Pseudomonas sp. CAN1 TaxID=3046726 RepID=UPI002649D258|nr:M24 family metallopeptidase [Pseudomonas sp. CAN1]MDN6859246.1 M24 family metallopeptidase [Pseudomonas sp. CAN1]
MHAIEKTGLSYNAQTMLEARARAWAVIDELGTRVQPGMSEADCRALLRTILKAHGLLRGWHEAVVRVGRNTLKEYGNPSEADVVLGADDLFFVDIGPVFGAAEADAGKTFVVGQDADMLRAATDVKTLWNDVRALWQSEHITGAELYRFAERQAQEMGWELNLKRMSGHRIGDFPHEPCFDGLLSEVDIHPTSGLWILEMHIRHKTRPFGAFYEDLLVEEAR